MAEVANAESNLLQQKWGPLPVWVWGLIGLVAAWLFAKYRDLKSSASQAQADQTQVADATGAAEGQAVAPQFIIENNLPSQPSAPVTTTPVLPPVVTPPGTTNAPPVVTGTPVTTTKPPVTAPPAKKAPISYKVVHGDTLSSIAARYHTTWQNLWSFNTTAGNRPASTIATLKQRGPNLLYAGETILIPQ